MEAFTTLTAIGIPIDIANCDTDQIIPARFLRHPPGSPGYERYLFHDKRYDADGNPRPDFVMNRAPFDRGRVVVADVNWGCGSSREGAVKVLLANGIRCVIAPSFGDIHYNNCLQNGVLPVRLPAAVCDALRAALTASPGAEIAVDLAAQTVRDPEGGVHRFEIAPFDRRRLLEGLDEIEMTLTHATEIEAYERTHEAEYDWLER
jgi:3-isopropylmalate/(R)-2-methylmalate dehydratase small subunit